MNAAMRQPDHLTLIRFLALRLQSAATTFQNDDLVRRPAELAHDGNPRRPTADHADSA